MEDKIKISLPLERREVDAAQDLISIFTEENDKKKLEQTIRLLTNKTEQANKNGLPHDAEKLSHLVRLASMHLEELRDIDKHVK